MRKDQIIGEYVSPEATVITVMLEQIIAASDVRRVSRIEDTTEESEIRW